MKVKIYKLTDPVTNEIRYIGKTEEKHLIIRLVGHIQDLKRFRNIQDKQIWIKSLLDLDLLPIIELIEEVDFLDSKTKEQYWISYYLNKNCNLLNIVHNKNSIMSNIRIKNSSKKIYQYNLDGDFIKEWDSLTEAANYYDIDSSNIGTTAKKQKRSTGNYQWRYFKKIKINKHIINNKYKKVYEYDFNGNFVKEYQSAILASKELNLYTRMIYKCCENNLKSYKNKRFSFNKVDSLGMLIRKIRKDKGITKSKI